MTYRAAYWTDDNGAEVVLTAQEHADLPDEELLAEAQAEACQTDEECCPECGCNEYVDFRYEWHPILQVYVRTDTIGRAPS